MNKHQLAVVIPAYKDKYFDKALQSLANQTCKDFTVYIGNDDSPYDLDPIVDKYRHSLDIVYEKFDNNIGAREIVLQWERCIDLTRNEPWIWLFSDDDLAEETCVANFFELLKSGVDSDVYRFNTRVIDAHDKLVWQMPPGPDHETSEEMAYHLLLAKRGNSMPDHIFSREVYNKTGGFVHTPFAQGADWATSMRFSREKGMRIIPDATLSWRYSGINITSQAGKARRMLPGHMAFISWVLMHFEYLKSKQHSVSYDAMKKAALVNLSNALVAHYKGAPFYNFFTIVLFLNKEFGMGYFSGFAFLINVVKRRVAGVVKRQTEVVNVPVRKGLSKMKRKIISSSQSV